MQNVGCGRERVNDRRTDPTLPQTIPQTGYSREGTSRRIEGRWCRFEETARLGWKEMANQEEDRWTDRKTDRDGKGDRRRDLGCGGWHGFLTKEKKVGNGMRHQTEQNESLQNME